MEKKNINKITTNSVVDCSTGELIGETAEIQTYQVEKEPAYVKLYTQDIGRLYGLSPSCNNLLIALAKHMIYGSNVVLLYGPVKDIICQELNMTKNTLNKAIDTLYQEGFLIRKSRACYILDPTIFGSGSWKDVKKIRLSIEYDKNGKKIIKTELTRGNQIEEFGRGIPQRKINQLPLFEDEE